MTDKDFDKLKLSFVPELRSDQAGCIIFFDSNNDVTFDERLDDQDALNIILHLIQQYALPVNRVMALFGESELTHETG